MDTKEFYSWISFGLACSAYVPYVWMTLKSTVKPTIASWLCWFMMDLAILAAMYSSGANYHTMVAFVLGTTVVIVVALYRGAMVGWSKIDTVCVGMVVIAILLWYLSGTAEVAIVTSLAAMAIGSYPMWVNLWKDPSRESLIPWSIIVTSSVFQLMGAKSWSIADALTPECFLVIQLFTITLISRRYFKQNKLA